MGKDERGIKGKAGELKWNRGHEERGEERTAEDLLV